MREWLVRSGPPGAVFCAVVALAGCADPAHRPNVANEQIQKEMERAVTERAKPASPEAVSQALLPPLVVQMPGPDAAPMDQRFDLSVNNAPASQVFMAVVSGSRYSMIVHPDVREPISLNLKNVTVGEALEAIRELYGYEYRVQGDRIVVQPLTMQTRVFKVNYLQAQRKGKTDVRVSSGSITDSPVAGAGGVPGSGVSQPMQAPQTLTESSRVTTTSESNFWKDIAKSMEAIIGTGNGRSVIVNPQSGVIVVRAMPQELRQVNDFLNAMQLIVERQVMLEAKIVEVVLRDGFEQGVNWAAFRSGNTRGAVGQILPGAELTTSGPISTPTARNPDGSVNAASTLTATLGAAASSLVAGAALPGGVFGLALQTADFAALIAFLETQGTVNVLSSPRVATINNQKAVLKVGTDEFFVTNVTTTSTTSGSSTTIAPTISVQPFFSGIALDVTPQVDDLNNILLHVHPSVSNVIEKRKVVDLGNLGTFTLPLASSDVNETDTIVRVQDGTIVAIGGLMRQQSNIQGSQVPGIGEAPGIGALFRNRSNTSLKAELVVLIKPTIVRSDADWQKDLIETRDRIRTMVRPAPPEAQQQK